MTIIAKSLLGKIAGFDTMESLDPTQYVKLAALGFQWGCRYVPLSGQSPKAPGVVAPLELGNALAIGLGMMFVQFGRTGGISQASGFADGTAAADYVLNTLDVPNTVCLWADIAATDKQQALDYCNAWFAGATKAGMDPKALGGYFEPGVPLTAEERYSLIHWHRYWATAANDPNRFVAHRGCQIYQLFMDRVRGEYSPIPGVGIDADSALMDFFGDAPIGAFAG
jgi:hypothetical protein